MCESRGGRPGLLVPNSPSNSPYSLGGHKATLEEDKTSELRSCVKVAVAVMGSPSLIVLNMVSVDVKRH